MSHDSKVVTSWGERGSIYVTGVRHAACEQPSTGTRLMKNF